LKTAVASQDLLQVPVPVPATAVMEQNQVPKKKAPAAAGAFVHRNRPEDQAALSM
jgi:hypothetical protein